MKWMIFLLLPALMICTSCQKKMTSLEETQVFRCNFPFDPPTLDPRKGADVIASTVHFMLYEGLTRMTPKSTHEPALAKTIDISSDQLVYTFHLRDSNWSDGSPVTANDFAYAWTTMLDPSFPCPNANLLYPIKNSELVKKGELPADQLGIRVINDKTLEVTLERPTPYFLDLTSFCVFFPVPEKIASLYPNWAEKIGPNLVTNGPFQLNSWKPNDRLSFSKNPSFWQKDAVTLQKIEINILNDEVTTLGMFNQKEIDFMGGFFTNIPIDIIPNLIERKLLLKHPVGCTSFISFNLDRFPFQNKHIRKALAYAINRNEIIKNITQADECIATGCIPPILKESKHLSFYKDGEVNLALEEFELGLKELGIGREYFHKFSIGFFTETKTKKVALAIQEQLRKALGIELKLAETDFKTFLGKLNSRDYDLALTAWMVQYNDQMNVLDRFKLKSNPKNYPGFENQEYIRLLESSGYATDPSNRLAILEKAEELITEEMPFACIYHWNLLYLQQSYVEGLFISPVGSHHFNNVKIVKR
jgi:oligopeptide transport system substrate-binding protein